MSDRMKCCTCCDEPLSFQWCDTHGIAACNTCGMPYRIYHYEGPEGQQKRIDKPPECVIVEAWQAVGRRYWQEQKMRVFPAEFDMGISRGGRSYSGASIEEHEAFWSWVKAHDAEMPKAA